MIIVTIAWQMKKIHTEDSTEIGKLRREREEVYVCAFEKILHTILQIQKKATVCLPVAVDTCPVEIVQAVSSAFPIRQWILEC